MSDEGQSGSGTSSGALSKGLALGLIWWTVSTVLVLVILVGAALVLAWCRWSEHPPKHRCEDKVECAEACETGRHHRESVAPDPPDQSRELTVVVNVNGAEVSVESPPPPSPKTPQSPTPSPCVDTQEPQQTQTEKDSSSSAEAIVIVDRRKIIEGPKQIVSPPEVVEQPVKELVGRVRFEAGRCRVRAQRSDIETVAARLWERRGAVLVVGHPDRCGSPKLVERRAKATAKALRTALKRRAGSRRRARLTGLHVHAQGAFANPAAAQDDCDQADLGTATIYLVEELG